jgi:hypothetical protein
VMFGWFTLLTILYDSLLGSKLVNDVNNINGIQ